MRLYEFLKLTESNINLSGWYNAKTGIFLQLDRGEDEMYHHFDLAFDNPKEFGGKRVLGNVVDTTDLIAKVAKDGWVRTNHFGGVLYLDVTPETAKPAVAWGAEYTSNIVVGIWPVGKSFGEIKEIKLNNLKEIKAFLESKLTETINSRSFDTLVITDPLPG